MRAILKTTLAIALLVLWVGSVGAQGVIGLFSAHAENDDYAVLSWTSNSETGLAYYRVERSLDGLSFLSLAEVSPQGNGTEYRYEDHDLFKGGTRTYYYRIRAVMSNNTSSLSSVQSVTLAFSGIQQTWGSIKALFR